MKATGIVRKVDELGRITLPRELRRTLNINDGDSLEIFTDSNGIVLCKYERGCTMCGGMDELTTYGSNKMCCKCFASFAEEFGKVGAK